MVNFKLRTLHPRKRTPVPTGPTACLEVLKTSNIPKAPLLMLITVLLSAPVTWLLPITFRASQTPVTLQQYNHARACSDTLLKMLHPWQRVLINFPETSATNYQSLTRNIPEQRKPLSKRVIRLTGTVTFQSGHRVPDNKFKKQYPHWHKLLDGSNICSYDAHFYSYVIKKSSNRAQRRHCWH